MSQALAPCIFDESIAARARALFHEHWAAISRRTDRMFGLLMIVQWVGGIIAALIITPRAWNGPYSQIHQHVLAAVALGGTISAVPLVMIWVQPGRWINRYIIAVAQMLTSALLIDISGGRIETHFHVFGSLAFLAFYRDWTVLVPASLVVAADHLIRGLWWPQSVYGVLTASPWRFVEHAAWVVFEDIFLVASCLRGLSEIRAISLHRAELEAANETSEANVVRRTAELAASEGKIRAILNGAADSIITIDDCGRILDCNCAAERTFGYAAGALLGRDISVLMPWPHAQRRPQNIARFLATEEKSALGQVRETTGRRADGSSIPLELSVSEVKDGGDRFYTGILRDMTERKALEAEQREKEKLEQERNSLRDAVKALEQVLGIVGHELRTPLASIRAMAEFLLDEEARDTQEGQSFLNSINAEVQRMAAMVNDLLEVARLNSGAANWNWTELALDAACEQAVETVRPLVNVSKVKLEYGVHPPGLMMRGDAGAVRRLMTNLLTNACKHTREGSVSIDIRNELRLNNRFIRIEIRDTGEGMTPEIAKRLGMAFALNSGMIGESHVKGSGLGLTISRGIVAAHGGTFEVSSAQGKGTVVTVLLQADLEEPKPVKDAADIICEVQA